MATHYVPGDRTLCDLPLGELAGETYTTDLDAVDCPGCEEALAVEAESAPAWAAYQTVPGPDKAIT